MTRRMRKKIPKGLQKHTVPATRHSPHQTSTKDQYNTKNQSRKRRTMPGNTGTLRKVFLDFMTNPDITTITTQALLTLPPFKIKMAALPMTLQMYIITTQTLMSTRQQGSRKNNTLLNISSTTLRQISTITTLHKIRPPTHKTILLKINHYTKQQKFIE